MNETTRHAASAGRLTRPEAARLARECRSLRNTIVDMIHAAQSGHTGGSLSCVEILWLLYTRHLRVKPDDPVWPDRDRFILSKGHAAPALYAVLAARGFFGADALPTLRRTGSMLQGHPDMRKVPGVEMSTGSLGMGISAGIGMALAARLAGRDSRVCVLVGDGELNEGQIWEALMAARKYELSNLAVIVDKNDVQLDGTTQEVMPLLDVRAKFGSFGWAVRECDGHDIPRLDAALRWATGAAAGPVPRVVIACTVKGKGVSFMEGKSEWHGKQIGVEDYRAAKEELGR